MIYRNWREITKAPLLLGTKLSKSKMTCPGTSVYDSWFMVEINMYPAPFDGRTKAHGILAPHERFLRWLETAEGERNGEVESADEVAVAPKICKMIIIPVVVPSISTYNVVCYDAAERYTKARQLRGPGAVPIRKHTQRRCSARNAGSRFRSKRQVDLAELWLGHGRQE
ncbi:hypothetical protein EI94DRAFT_1060159 [Lactarius quietus]|nr:hypothetical protein EI94DRAFT_1060159 [Lactarius quietus]